jgi:hypothetical protein
MAGWARTPDGWAVNLDGSDAATAFALPRIELHSSPLGWTGVCHLEGGASRALALHAVGSAAQARRTAVEEARRALGERWQAALGALL